MPELPEVETTRRGIAPHLTGRTLTTVTVRDPRLRWPVPDQLATTLSGAQLVAVQRRAKYLLLRFGRAESATSQPTLAGAVPDTGLGTLILHLGMSGSLRVLPASTPAQAHDHIDLVFGEVLLRLRDPRRFGAVFWTTADPLQHPRLRALGPEPLSDAFAVEHLHAAARGRRVAVKSLLMDNHVVVGVGNIYATEALFMAGIHPARRCDRIAFPRYRALTGAVKTVLAQAIAAGGTTLRDFQREDGRPGYFRIQLQAYGRAGEPCPRCGGVLKTRQIGQRASAYCPHCQR